MKIILIIERLKSYFKVDTDVALAKELGISPTTLSNWKTRNTIDYDLIFTICEDIDYNWLFKNKVEIVNDSPPPNKLQYELCNEKEKQINALERIIETQAKLIRKYEDDEEKKPHLRMSKKERPGNRYQAIPIPDRPRDK